MTADWRFHALQQLSAQAAQPVVYGSLSSSSRRARPSFSLLDAGSWKARYVSLCAWFLNDNACDHYHSENIVSLLSLPGSGRFKASCCPSRYATNVTGASWLWQQSWLSEKGSGNRLAVREIMGVARATYLRRRCSVQLPCAQRHPPVTHPCSAR